MRSRRRAAGPGLSAVLFVFTFASSTAAQSTGALRGTVRSATDNSPITGAQIVLEGTRLGGPTNDDGRYLIPGVPAGTYTVTVQLIGFAPQRREGVVIEAGQTAVADFELRTQVLSMAEIVVTGVTEGTSRAKLPFTVAKVSADAMPVPPKAAVSSIQGKVAGVNIVQSAAPGAGANIMLRTPTSINRNNSPLIVVDGAILTSSSVDLSTLDIESVEVVKGAAAASLYGSRAASGVIQIRTARGSAIQEGRTRFSIRSEYGSNSIMKPIDWAVHHNLQLTQDGSSFVNAQGEPVERQFAAPTRFGFQDQKYPGTIYDHIDALFDPGQFITNAFTLGFNGGNTSWIATGSQHHTSGIVTGNDGYRRGDFRVNLDHRLRNDLAVSLSGFHMRAKTDNLPGDPFFDFIHQSPDINLRTPDPDGTPYSFQPDPVGIRANPLYQIATRRSETKRMRTLASMDARFNPIGWLGFDVNASYDRSDVEGFALIPRGVKTPDSPNGHIGSTSRSNAISNGFNVSAGAAIARDFGALRTRTSLRVLSETEENEAMSAGAADAAVGGLSDLDAFLNPTTGSSSSEIHSRGYYLSSDLDYADRYIFSGLVRRDGSSLFGREDRWHWYYRASGAWRLSAEEWWPLAESVNEFKLHYSRGTAGGRPNFADRFEVFGLGAGGLTLNTLGNIFLRPEKTTEQEFGLTAVAFERFSAQLVYAKQRTVDQLVQVPLPALYGFTTQWQNAGTIEGSTYEATLEARVVERPGLLWSVTGIADRSRNRIVEYDRPCHAAGLGMRCAGEVLGEMWTRRLWRSHDDLPAVHANSRDAFQVNDDGLLVPVGSGRSWRDGTTGCPDLAPTTQEGCWGKNIVIDGITYQWGMPRQVVDESGQPVRVKTGDANPDMNWGIANQLRLGRLNVYALVGGQVGGHVYNATKQRMYQYARHRDVDQAGRADELKKPASYYTGPLYNGNVDTDWFIEDATYTKLRELSVRYNLDPERVPFLDRTRLRNVALSVIGRNLFIITGYSGYDPEIGGILTREDSFNYPTYRTFTFSIDIEF